MSVKGPMSAGVFQRFADESNHQDLVRQMFNGGLTAQQAERQLGIPVLRTGELVSDVSNTMRNQSQGFQPQDPRNNPRSRPQHVPVPHPETPKRDDQYIPRVRPGI